MEEKGITMRRMVLCMAIVVISGAAMAQTDDTALRGAMKQVGPLVGGLGKKISAKDSSAAGDAEKLQALFAEVRKFWEARSAPDAAEFAAKAAAEFGEISKLVKASDWDGAAGGQKKAGANCMGCHSAHREKADDGGWKIK